MDISLPDNKPHSLSDYKRLYTKFRTKYFLNPPPDRKALPLAEDLRWYWLTPQSAASALAQTSFDEDDEPCDIGFCPSTRTSTHIMRYILLHEMTHMRVGYKYSCGQVSHKWYNRRVPQNTVWHQETLRLVSLGALIL